LKLHGVDESLADQLMGKNIFSTAVLAQKSVDDLIVIRSISEEFAARLIEQAKLIPFVAKENPQEDSTEESEPKQEALVTDTGKENDAPAETMHEDEGAEDTGVIDNPDE
jgi:hypothetical protein